MNEWRCPHCRKLLLRYDKHFRGALEIACERCKRIVRLEVISNAPSKPATAA